IITKAPSAGLWDGQSDEDELGLSYRELDYYLVDGEAESETAARIEEIAAANQHKLELPAIPDF
ncbi:MAG: NAD+ synthase, partial [Halanaerobium sp.]